MFTSFIFPNPIEFIKEYRMQLNWTSDTVKHQKVRN